MKTIFVLVHALASLTVFAGDATHLAGRGGIMPLAAARMFYTNRFRAPDFLGGPASFH